MQERGCTLKDILVALGCAVVVLLVYIPMLPSTVTGEDSGELITAAYSLGVAHPPGYPVWCMIGHLFTYIPWGSIAWRVAFMSAFFGAATVFLLVLLGMQWFQNRWAAVAAGLTLAFSWEFWEQALLAEIYTLNTFFILLAILVLWKWRATRLDRWRYAFALLFGVGLGVHNTMLLLAPAFIIFVLTVDAAPLKYWKTYILMSAVALLGAQVYWYLYFASQANPAMDWGDPDTLTNFFNLVQRKQYSFMFSQYPHTCSRFLRQMGIMGHFWTQQFTWVGLLLALFGILWGFRRDWRNSIFFLSLGVSVTAGFAFVQNFDFDNEWLWIMTVFGIPSYMMTALFIGIGLDSLSRLPHARIAAMGLALLCVCASLYSFHYRNDKSSYFWAEDYAKNILRSMEEDSLFIPESDHASFAPIYLQSVEGRYPAITIGRRCGYLDPTLLEEMPAERRARYLPFPRQKYEPEIFTWLLRNTNRPIYFQRPPRLPDAPEIRFEQTGMIYRALRPGESLPERDYFAAYSWHTLAFEDTRQDQTARLILCEYTLARAKMAFSAGEKEKGLKRVYEALSYYGQDAIMLNNAGTICARAHCYEEAQQFFEAAHALAPDKEVIQNNVRRIHKKLGIVF